MTEWNKLTSLRQDVCAQTLEENQSQMPGIYSTKNHYLDRWCEGPVKYANMMSEPMHWQKDYRNACSVDADSHLRYSDLTNMRYINQLSTRPYVGNPAMQAGNRSLCNKDLETQLLTGYTATTFKSTEPTSGVTIDRFECLPEFGNPQRVQHTVEPWVRGGDQTRDYVRRVDWERYCMNKGNNKAINPQDYSYPTRVKAE